MKFSNKLFFGASIALATIAAGKTPAVTQPEAISQSVTIPRVKTLPDTVTLTKDNGDTFALKIEGPKAVADVFAEAYVASYIKTWNKCVTDRIARSEPRIAKLYDGQLFRAVKWVPGQTSTDVSQNDTIAIGGGSMKAERVALYNFYEMMFSKENPRK